VPAPIKNQATGAVMVPYPVAACDSGSPVRHAASNGKSEAALDSRVAALTRSISKFVVSPHHRVTV